MRFEINGDELRLVVKWKELIAVIKVLATLIVTLSAAMLAVNTPPHLLEAGYLFGWW